jgi:hypothetical protein
MNIERGKGKLRYALRDAVEPLLMRCNDAPKIRLISPSLDFPLELKGTSEGRLKINSA